MEDETEKMRAELLEFISTCEDEVLLEQILEAAKKYHNENDWIRNDQPKARDYTIYTGL